jgi:hypothetical protein
VKLPIDISEAISFALIKSLIATPFLLIAFFSWGDIREHGDVNAAGMYSIAFGLQGFTISVCCYILYYFADKITLGKKINFIKNFAHLALAFGLVLISVKEPLIIASAITIVIVLAINLITSLGHYLKIT